MGHIAEKILDAVEAEVRARVEWDECPGLYFLYLEGGEARVSRKEIFPYTPPSRDGSLAGFLWNLFQAPNAAGSRRV